MLCCVQMGLDVTTEEFSAQNVVVAKQNRATEKGDAVRLKTLWILCYVGTALLLSSVQPLQLGN